jgi:hypothetical protein
MHRSQLVEYCYLTACRSYSQLGSIALRLVHGLPSIPCSHDARYAAVPPRLARHLLLARVPSRQGNLFVTQRHIHMLYVVLEE